MTAFCTNCGTPATEADRFCASCGQQLNAPRTRGTANAAVADVPTDEVGRAGPPTGAPAGSAFPPQPHDPGDGVPPRQPRSWRKVAIISGAVIAAGALIAGGLLAFSGTSPGGDDFTLAPDIPDRPDIAWTFDVRDHATWTGDWPPPLSVGGTDGETLVVFWQSADDWAIYGIDLSTGESRWETDPFQFDVGFRPSDFACYIVVEQTAVCRVYHFRDGDTFSAIVGLDLADGTQRWSVPGAYEQITTGAVVDGEIVVFSSETSGDFELSRITADGDVLWTAHDTIPDGLGSASVQTSDQFIILDDYSNSMLGFRADSGAPVPWLTTRTRFGDVQYSLAGEHPLRIERWEWETIIEQLDDDGSFMWSYSYPASSHTCMATSEHYVYLCTDDYRSVTAINRNSGEELWTAGLRDDINYAGRSADALVLAGDNTLIVLDIETGERRWQRRSGELTQTWGYPVSGQHVYVPETGALVAYSLDEGEPAWRMPVPLDETTTYVNPRVIGDRLTLVANHWVAAVG